MKPMTAVDSWSVGELRDIAQAAANPLVSDLDFLETLAERRCILAPPWVVQLATDGRAERLMRIPYDKYMNISKCDILLRVLDLPAHTRARQPRPEHEVPQR